MLEVCLSDCLCWLFHRLSVLRVCSRDCLRRKRASQIVCAGSLLYRLSVLGVSFTDSVLGVCFTDCLCCCFTDCLCWKFALQIVCSGSLLHIRSVLAVSHRLSVLGVGFRDCLGWESASQTVLGVCFTDYLFRRLSVMGVCSADCTGSALYRLFRILSVLGVCSTDYTGSPLYRLSVSHIVCAGSLLHSLMAERGNGGGGRQFWIGGQLRSLFS